MANNRMYLLHKPTGRAVFLGKRMAWGWYRVPDDIKERLEALFEAVEDDAGTSQDDFAIALECATDQPHAIDDWEQIGDDGKIQLIKLGQSVKIAERGSGI